MRTAFWLAVAFVSAAIAWCLHHTAFFSEHAVLSAIIAVLTATASSVLVVGLAVNRRHLAPPVVVVANRGENSVREARQSDIDFCAAVHAQSLSHGFFVSLGPTFLRAYYESFLTSPYSVAHVVSVGGHDVGMIVGLLSPREHVRWTMRKRGPILAVLGAGAMVTRPLLSFRFIKTRIGNYLRSWRNNRDRDTAAETGPSVAVLSHVAVVPGARGSGVGLSLVTAFLNDARNANIGLAVLTTLEGDRGARSFYLRNGWTETDTRRTVDGQVTHAMSFPLKA